MLLSKANKSEVIFVYSAGLLKKSQPSRVVVVASMIHSQLKTLDIEVQSRQIIGKCQTILGQTKSFQTIVLAESLLSSLTPPLHLD